MTVLKSVLFVFSLFLIACLLLPVELYGSIIVCDPSLNLTNCDERSSSSSTSDTETIDNSRSDNTETPLIIPDISPTDKDLSDSTAGGDLGTTNTDATNDNNDDDNDDSENSIDENSDTDRENDKDSSDSEDGSSDDERSLIPFP